MTMDPKNLEAILCTYYLLPFFARLSSNDDLTDPTDYGMGSRRPVIFHFLEKGSLPKMAVPRDTREK